MCGSDKISNMDCKKRELECLTYIEKEAILLDEIHNNFVISDPHQSSLDLNNEDWITVVHRKRRNRQVQFDHRVEQGSRRVQYGKYGCNDLRTYQSKSQSNKALDGVQSKDEQKGS